MEYFTEFNTPPVAIAESGSGIRDVVKTELNDKEEYEVKTIGKVNEYEKIQSMKESCLLSNLIERFQNGDLNALNKKPTDNYGDTTIIPKTIHEQKEMAMEAQEKMSSLPNNLQEKILLGETISKEDILKAFEIKEPEIEEIKNEVKGEDING